MEAVDKSTVSGVNVAKLSVLHGGTVLVPVHDWAKFLETFKKIPGISKFHHFRFSKDHPGVVFCNTLVGSPKMELTILKSPNVRPPNQLPPKIIPLVWKTCWHLPLTDFWTKNVIQSTFKLLCTACFNLCLLIKFMALETTEQVFLLGSWVTKS